MKNTIISLIAGIIALLTLSGVANAADETYELSPAIWADQHGTYTADGSGEVKVYPYEFVEDLGPAIWADEFGTYTADGSGEVKFYPNEATAIGSAIWTDGQYIYTADTNGVIAIIPCEPAVWVAPATK